MRAFNGYMVLPQPNAIRGWEGLQLAHLADTHIGATRYRFSGISSDIRYMLERSLEALERDHIRLVVMAGDLFDKPKPNIEDIEWTIRLLKEYCDKGFTFVSVSGEHDTPGRRDSTTPDLLDASLDCFYNIASSWQVSLRSDPPTAKIRGVFFIGIPHLRGVYSDVRRKAVSIISRRAEQLARGEVGPKVLVAHLGLEGYTHPSDALIAPQDLPRGFTYYALGHIHRRIIETRLAPAPFSYPAPLVPLSRDEFKVKERGPLIVDLTGDMATVEPLNLDLPREYIAVHADLQSLEEAVEEALQNATRRERPPLVAIVLRAEGVSASSRELAPILRRLEKRHNAEFRVVDIKRVPMREISVERISQATPVSEHVDDLEVEVLASLLGGNMKLAQLVRDLKKALIEKNSSEIEKLIDAITGSEFDEIWDELVFRKPSGRIKTKPSPIEGKPKRGLEGYLS